MVFAFYDIFIKLHEDAIPRRAAPGFVIARRPQADVAISGRQLRFRREYHVIQPGSARFPRRFAPRNDKLGSLTP